MNIKQINIDELKPYEQNPRVNDKAVLGIMNSIQEYGFLVPMVIDRDMTIVTGHTRWKAGKRLGLETVPCIVAEDLTEQQINAFRIADNRLAENSVWDEELLSSELRKLKKEGMDLQKTGFSFGEVEELLASAKAELETANEKLPEMELKSFESYDYVVFVFDDLQDWLNIQQEFGLEKKEVGFSRKHKRVGLGRVIRGEELLKRLK